MNQLWNGFPIEEFEFDGRYACVVCPREGTANGRLALKTEYWNAFVKTEVALLEAGFHLCYIRNDNRWGTDPDLDRKAAFVAYVAEQWKLSPKCVPVGMSCGGLFAIKFAAKFPHLVSCLYLDAPVLNYLSCPCGFGTGEPLARGEAVQELLQALQLNNVSQLIGYREMPLDKLSLLVQARIPVILVAGDADVTVPYRENGAYLEQAYHQAGLPCQVHIKPGCAHHPHGLEDPQIIVRFILTHEGEA